MENISTFNEFLNEAQEMRGVEASDAKDFVTEVLKLGSTQNLFDAFIKKKGIAPEELSTLVNSVIDELDKNWR